VLPEDTQKDRCPERHDPRQAALRPSGVAIGVAIGVTTGTLRGWGLRSARTKHSARDGSNRTEIDLPATHNFPVRMAENSSRRDGAPRASPDMNSQHQVLIYTSAFLLGISLQRWLRSQMTNAREKLNSPAARAAQWMAAMRAVEGLENENALFVDEMASAMSGKKAFRRALGSATKVPFDHADERLYKMSEVALGTWWFDRQLITLLTSNSLATARGWLSARLRNSARGLAGPPRQVVVVGSGFDTRPWRMAQAPMTKWLEIDVPEVVNAKRRRLQTCNAELEIHSNAGYFPLRTVQWDIHAADVTSGSTEFDKILDMYGFDLGGPIVWVVENVLMYLSQEHVKGLLTRLAAVSAPGSILVGNSTVNRNAELIGEGKHGSYPADIVGHWVSSLPGAQGDLEVALHEADWELLESCTQRDIALAVCNGRDVASICSGLGDSGEETGHCPTDVYFFARKFY
jgi:methyltransferase (TIGR00027 family)